MHAKEASPILQILKKNYLLIYKTFGSSIKQKSFASTSIDFNKPTDIVP